MRVFIIDDSSVIVERLTLLLEDVPGVELIGHAADVPQAIQRLLETTPDALVLDLHLPGGTGLDVLRAIRPVRPGVHVLVFTNHSQDEYPQQFLTPAATNFPSHSPHSPH